MTDQSIQRRIRHIKCDEEKPACLKCRSTGRVCDGYLANQKPRVSPSMPEKQGQALTNAMVSPFSNPYVGFVGTDQERRGFEYFHWETAQNIGGALNLDCVHRLILQAGQSNPAVRSAVIALGTITEQLQVNSVLAFDKPQSNSYQEFPQAQYRQALRQLREQLTREPHRAEKMAMISCFLFTLFEFLQGNDTASIVHLRSGLNILRQQQGIPGPFRQELLRIFSVMDLQATLWLGLKTLRPPMITPVDPGSLSLESESFCDIEDAAISLNFLTSRVYNFRRLVTSEAGKQNSQNIVTIKRDLGTQLEWWPIALEQHLVKLDAGMSVETLHRTFVMRMNHTLTRIAFGVCLHEDEERVFRAHLSDFRDIVSLAKIVIRPMDPIVKARVQRIVAANNASLNPVAVFSYYAGVIQPLYMTAIQCTDVKVCREAIRLLSTSPWQEGAWDSARMAEMAERKVRQLEKTAIMAMALI